MDFIQLAIRIMYAHLDEIIVAGAVMVSVIIMAIGVLKPLLYDRITCKPLRKCLLAFTNIGFSFLATALYFLFEGINWRWYWIAAILVSVACIITYWFYENTCLRNLVQKIGTIVIDKLAVVAKVALTSLDAKLVARELNNAKQEIKTATAAEIKSAGKLIGTKSAKKADKELENL